MKHLFRQEKRSVCFLPFSNCWFSTSKLFTIWSICQIISRLKSITGGNDLFLIMSMENFKDLFSQLLIDKVKWFRTNFIERLNQNSFSGLLHAVDIKVAFIILTFPLFSISYRLLVMNSILFLEWFRISRVFCWF